VRKVSDPDELGELFGADRETHLYGLADLEEPYWSASVWFRDGSAAVGLVSVGDDWVTGYAMSRVAPEATVALLAEVQARLPGGSWVTGPVGMYESISQVRSTRAIGPHWRMILEELNEQADGPDAVTLGANELDALNDLHRSDEGGAFFLPTMMKRNPFVGIWEDGRLVASAGTHVVSKRHGVAAIGAVITRPSHRGRGLGRLVMSALCRHLMEHYETIGLNVETANQSALHLYERLGFRAVFQYEEIELI